MALLLAEGNPQSGSESHPIFHIGAVRQNLASDLRLPCNSEEQALRAHL
jgi:hypothetical protein